MISLVAIDTVALSFAFSSIFLSCNVLRHNSLAASQYKGFCGQGDSVPIAGYSNPTLRFSLGIWKGILAGLLLASFSALFMCCLLISSLCYREISIIGGLYFYILRHTSRNFYLVEMISFYQMIFWEMPVHFQQKLFCKF